VENPPRVFVGTMTHGEAEFDACVAAIAAQTGVAVTHHIIRDQPELEAHNQLWSAWDMAKPSHDLFVKIDGDTILNRDTALAEIATLFSNPDVTGAQIPLHDYFTDDLINGLNAFSPAVKFRAAKRRLFADHADYGHKIVLKGQAVEHLAPIGWHCRNPRALQAFHYGFHRALKGQVDTVRKIARAYAANPDAAREWALAGAASARWWHFGSDYRSRALNTAYTKLGNDNVRHARVDGYVRALKMMGKKI
jgi:hypothetical protein